MVIIHVTLIRQTVDSMVIIHVTLIRQTVDGMVIIHVTLVRQTVDGMVIIHVTLIRQSVDGMVIIHVTLAWQTLRLTAGGLKCTSTQVYSVANVWLTSYDRGLESCVRQHVIGWQYIIYTTVHSCEDQTFIH